MGKAVGKKTKRRLYPANIYLFKVNNKNTRAMCETCSKLVIKNNVNVVVLVSLLLTLNRFHILLWCLCSPLFEKVNVGLVGMKMEP